MRPPECDTEYGPGGIAIIGKGCRFPGARNVSELWDLLVEGRDTVGTYPGGRFPKVDAFLAEAAASTGDAAMALGGFIERIDAFDAAAFDLSPREAMYIDPQHRMLLECAWAALEDAGQVRQDPKTRSTGVFVGLWASDFENVLYGSGADLEFYAMTGGGSYGASGRLSFTFGFEGPSVSVDAACSSSLVAVHLACQSLLSGECGMALAGGANAILSAESTRMFTKAGMLSREGRCKFGAAGANGFVRSEGAGIVVLKRLEDALAAGDPIHAVIRGGAVSNDGRTSGTLMTPSREGQRQTLNLAWAAAGVSGRDIRFFEAHGTGTSVGDPVEVGAIADALGDAGGSDTGGGDGAGCWIGSIKSNIGHTESAAGVAGLIKTVLALKHRVVPKSLLVGEQNPGIDWGPSLRLMTEPLNLVGQDMDSEERPAIAGVSSFALTGTNAHLVIQEYRQQCAPKIADTGPFLVPVSARSEWALDRLLQGYETYAPETGGLRDLAYTASLRRRHEGHRAAIVCESIAELNESAAAARSEELERETDAGQQAFTVKEGTRRRIVFIAPGQGSQWAGMARELFAEEPVFQQMLGRCDAALRVETGWSLTAMLLGNETADALREIDVVQPALFAMSVSLAELWRSWGIVPDAVIGHSMGEVAAACIAGALSLEDGAAVISRRSRLLKTIRGAGAMLTVELAERAVEGLLSDFEGEILSGLSIAASNSPETTIVSGDAEAIARLEELLLEREVFCRRVKVDVASHSAQVDPILDELKEALREITPKTCALPLFSTVMGGYVAGGEMDAVYWAENLRRAVGYAKGITALARDGYDVFIELSPHPVLLPATEATLKLIARDTVAVASMRREKPERREMLGSLGTLYRFGCEPAWKALYPVQAACVPLPEYPFQRERCWPELEELKVGAGTRRLRGSGHPLLGERFEAAAQPDTVTWEIVADPVTLPYLSDHRVHGTIVLPAAAQLELVLEALRVERPECAFAITAMRFEAAMNLPDGGSSDEQGAFDAREFQLALRRSGERYAFEIAGRRAGPGEVWTRHSVGAAEIRVAAAGKNGLNLAKISWERMRRIEKREHYRIRGRAGVGYGAAFQLVEEAWCGVGESLVRIRQVTENDPAKYLVHPTLLDNCFQALQLASPDGEGFLWNDTCLPVSIERMEIFASVPTAEDVFCHARVISADASGGALAGDLRLTDRDGVVLAVVRGFGLRRVSGTMEQRSAELLTGIAWEPYHLLARNQGGGLGLVVIFCDANGVGETLAERIEASGARAVLVRQGSQFSVRRGGPRGREYAASANHANEVRKVFADLVAHGERPVDVVHLWGLGQRTESEYGSAAMVAEQKAGAYFVPWLIQAMSACNAMTPPRLWLVTGGVVTAGDEAAAGDKTMRPELGGAPMWGVGVVSAVEHPELQATLVDLSKEPGAEEIDGLVRLLMSGADEDRIALRGTRMYVERFAAIRNEAVAEGARKPDGARALQEDEEYSVEVPSPGVLDNLVLQASGRVRPEAGEVTIEVVAAGLNFIDVTKAMGIYPTLEPNTPLRVGAECSGRVVAVGTGVTRFKIGDAVIAISSNPAVKGLMASRVCLPESSVVHKPEWLGFDDAAALPIAYLTAQHSLVEVARVCAGEWVLVPAGAGGVGLAAIGIALRVGAKVIATASTEEKREYLRAMGVRHAIPSRTLEFADEVMRITEGRGVDIVLNSLTGEYIAKGLEVLAPFGRFIEIGKRDIYADRKVGLKVFRNNLSYHVVDLAPVMELRPAYLAEVLGTVLKRIEAGELKTLPVVSFASGDPAAAFHHMAQGRHTGKIVLRMGRDVTVIPAAKKALFRRDAAYLIAGGMGGVGSTVAEWMAANGAGCVVLISRRAESDATQDILQRIEALGARAIHARADIVDRAEIDRMLASVRGEGMPIAGIMQAATVIDDALLTELSPSRFDAVMNPKVTGTWNLYDATMDDSLDFMVLFSSIASVYPQPGHGSYAAANAFLDSFARWARAAGRKVISINWGGWQEIGLARETGTGRSISGYGHQGFGMMSAGRALSALQRALETDVVQAIASPVDVEQAAEFFGGGRVPPVLRRLLAGAAAVESRDGSCVDETAVGAMLSRSVSLAESVQILEGYLIGELSRVLKLAKERIGGETLFGSIGLDSLMTLEFVRRLKAGLGVAVPTTSVFNHPTPSLLAAEIAKRMQLPPQTKVGAEVQVVAARTGLREMTRALVADEVSEDEALRALMQPVNV